MDGVGLDGFEVEGAMAVALPEEALGDLVLEVELLLQIGGCGNFGWRRLTRKPCADGGISELGFVEDARQVDRTGGDMRLCVDGEIANHSKALLSLEQ
jgi:hypothetical protein